MAKELSIYGNISDSSIRFIFAMSAIRSDHRRLTEIIQARVDQVLSSRF